MLHAFLFVPSKANVLRVSESAAYGRYTEFAWASRQLLVKPPMSNGLVLTDQFPSSQVSWRDSLTIFAINTNFIDA